MTSKSSAKNTRFSKSRLAFAIAAHMLAAGNALAGPSGGEVVGGVGNINQQGSETTITQTTDRMAIDWQSFDVGKDERVTFVQPGQSAVALNRILSNNGSEILGQIDANGHVILVNPHGVVFGEGAVINAGGLIASGLQINPDDFMNGDLVFKRIEGTDGTVINAGMINAASGGNVALVGTQVENRGLISARLGSVTLASGKEAVLTFDESGLLGVQVDEAILQSELGDKAAITNSGEINAEGGRILLSASTTRDVFSKAVNWGDQKQARSVTYNEDGSFTLGAGGDVVNSGEITVSGEIAGNIVALAENITSTGKIRADATKGAGGNVELHSNTTTIISEEGIVTANAEQGGDIKILGKNVGLFDSAGIEAIGENGGGQVLVGGDQEGLNNQIRNADFVYINEKASINASATASGDGGVAIVFAEDTARIRGNLSIRGGEIEGNGGFVETSGKKSFSITASPDVSAANGTAGHWLIDPYSITVSDSGNGVLTGGVFESGSEAGSTISPEIIEQALSSGADVTLQTGGESGDGAGNGNITIFNPIEVEMRTPAALNLIAHNNIQINANIIAKGDSGLSINLRANQSGRDGSIAFSGQGNSKVRVITNGGDFNIKDGDSEFGAHNVDLSNATIDLRFGVENEGFSGLARSGSLAVYASNNVTFGDIQISGREEAGDAAKINIHAGGDILVSTDWHYDNNPTDDLPDDSINDGYTTTQLVAGRNITVNAEMRPDPQHQNDTRPEHQDRMHFILSANGDIRINEDILTWGGNFTVENSRELNFQGGKIDTGSRYGAGSVTFNATDNITFGNMPMFGREASNTNGSLRNPSLTAEAGGILNIGNHDLYVRETIKLTAAEWEFNRHSLNTVMDSGDIILKSTRGIELPTIVSSGFLVVEAENDIRQGSSSSGIKNNKEASFLAHGHDVILSQRSNDFVGSVWVEEAKNLTLTTDRSLTLGREGMTMSLDGDLKITAAQGIKQLSAIYVEKGKTELSSKGDIELGMTQDQIPVNKFSSLNIGEADDATIFNARELELTGVRNIKRLNISVAGDLTQTASVDVDDLVLNISGVTTLANQSNRIDKIAGKMAGGELVVANSLQLGDDSPGGLTLSAATTVDASRIAVAKVLLSGAATLTFNGVERFNLLQKFEGEDAAVNTVVVNGGDGEGEYRISNNATWQEVDLRFNGSGGRDSLLIDDDAVTVALSINAPDAPAGAVVALDIERIEARNGARNTLIGGSSAGYEWNISSEFGGTVKAQDSERVVEFTNFHELQSGSQDDRFIINDGARMSAIRGGAGNDILDYSGWRGSLDVTIGGSARNVAEIDGIEVLVGNGNGTLQAPDGTNNWTISDGDIGGTFELVENNQMVYRGFNQIKGGSGVDTFVFTLDNKDAQYTLDGGGNEDSLEFLGGGEGWQGTYGGSNSDATFTFSSPAGSTTVGYRGMESIQLNASLDLMTLTGSQQMDNFHLNSQSWQWNEFLPVSYGGELRGLRIEGNRNDIIQLAGRIHLPEKLELVGGQLKFANDTLLETHELTLENPGGSVGSEDSPLDISVEKLTLTEINEDLYLRESNGLMLAGLSGSGTVNLQVLEGDLTQSDASGPINSQGDLLLDAAVGAIRLDRRDNRITGEVSLHAGTAATVYVLGDLRLAGVIAQDVNLQAGDDIRSDKILLVEGMAQFVSEGDITLTAAENNLNQVNVNAGGSVELTDIDRISFVGSSNIEGDLSIHADWLDFLGPTTANTLKADVRVAQVLSPVITRGDALFGSADVTGAWNIISLEGKVQAKSKVTGLERMIEVESLADIDPAIFTDVKNYFYQDISIQLPSDQIYEESDERKPFAGAGNF